MDLWIYRNEKLSNVDFIQNVEGWLSEEEQQRTEKIYSNKLKKRHVLTRALVRSVLSKYDADVAPKEWSFGKRRFGKPYILNPSSDVYFNVSHAGSYIVVGVSRLGEIGVDIEVPNKKVSPVEFAEHYFDEEEQNQVNRAAESCRGAQFLALWTLKEACLKASGEGLFSSLRTYRFSAPVDKSDLAIRGADEGAHSDRWHLWQLVLEKQCFLSLAMQLASNTEKPHLRIQLAQNDFEFSEYFPESLKVA